MRNKFGIAGPFDSDLDQVIDIRIAPHAKASVVLADTNMRQLKSMAFSLIPAWSKERKIKFATYNARLDSVLTKPSWKIPFQKRRILVPLSRFIEPIYTNEFAGNMVQFGEKNDSLLVAAGIYDQWMDRESKEVLESFAILTDEPSEFIAKIGHDRSPLFLRQEAWSEWLDPKERDPHQLIALLRASREEPGFSVCVDRPMAKGWEKRIPKD